MPGRKRLSRLYLDADLREQSELLLPSASAHYLKHVLRLQNGDHVALFNGQSKHDYLAEVLFKARQVYARPLTQQEQDVESPLDSVLIQAIGKSEHMDILVQKATELGIHRFIFFNSERTQSPLKGPRLEKRLQHWHGVSISACEQCGRNQLAQIVFADDLADALTLSTASNKILLDFGGQPLDELLPECDNEAGFALLTGAEGGLSSKEIELARSWGFKPCVIGPRTLRMETAAIAILTLVQHRSGDMR